jgi:hypothetical protein
MRINIFSFFEKLSLFKKIEILRLYFEISTIDETKEVFPSVQIKA